LNHYSKAGYICSSIQAGICLGYDRHPAPPVIFFINNKTLKVKKIISILIIAFPLICHAQAYFGISLDELKEIYPDHDFKISYNKEGVKWTTVDESLGTYVYYFDKTTDLIVFCTQVPDDLESLNKQIEIYNKMYVVISDTHWKAYLEGGKTMDIVLHYLEDIDTYAFFYTN
jgi:hypothetical protein